MARIRVLNERLINKIAAGEVVSRPASALKELLENSLDSGAKELRIDLEIGGKRLIRVVDNGEGMDGDDILLALERHATSKIKNIEDLDSISSLGFRGEALSSIAAVSRTVLRSRPAGEDSGREVVVTAGVIRGVKPVAMAPGTSIEVRSLFYNVPARKKFLSSSVTEFAHCQNVATHYALAFPEIIVRLRHNGRSIIDVPPANSSRERIAQLLGNSLLSRLVQFEEREEDVCLMGFVSEPSLNRADTSMLHFFVNRRVIRDKVLIHAVRTAYQDLLPKRRTPAAFLFLEMPPQLLDVNVHPSKTEVRFKQSSRVHDLVVRAIRKALSITQPLATVARSEKKPAKERKDGTPVAAREGSSGGSAAASLESLDKALRGRKPIKKLDFGQLKGMSPLGAYPSAAQTTQTKSRTETTSAQEGIPEPVPQTEAPSTEPPRFQGAHIDPDSVVPLGQLSNSYIVALFDGGIMLVDQHAAHERILYEQFRDAARGTPASQGLLHPLIVDLPPAQARLVENSSAELRSLGFIVEPFGPGSIAVRGMPASLEQERSEEIFVQIAADLEKIGSKAGREKLTKELVVSAACHGAIKVNTPLNKEKMTWLLDNLFRCEMPMRCPHGRPLVLTIGEEELRRRFGRS